MSESQAFPPSPQPPHPKRTGRTLYDLLAENPKTTIIGVSIIVSVIIYAIISGHRVSAGPLTIEPPDKDTPATVGPVVVEKTDTPSKIQFQKVRRSLPLAIKKEIQNSSPKADSIKPNISITQRDDGIVQLGPNSTVNKYGTQLAETQVKITKCEMNQPRDKTFIPITTPKNAKYRTRVHVSLKTEKQISNLCVYFGSIPSFLSFDWGIDHPGVFYSDTFSTLENHGTTVGAVLRNPVTENYILDIYTSDQIDDLAGVIRAFTNFSDN